MLGKTRVIAVGPNVPRLIYPVFYGLASLFGLALIGGLIGGSPTIVLAVFALLLIIFLVPPIHEHRIQARIKKAQKTLETMIAGLEDEGKLKFSKPLRLRPIIFRVEASKSWRGIEPYYVWSSRVEPRGVYEVKSCHEFDDLSYAIIVDKSSVGGAALPGVEFDEPGLHDIILLYIPSKQPILESSHYILKSPWGQMVEIRIQRGPGFKGEAKLSGGGRALIYIVAEYHETMIKTLLTKKVELPITRRVKIKLATLRSGEDMVFSVKLAPDSPVFIVAHKKSSLRALAWHLTKPLIAGDIPYYNLEVVFKQGISKKYIEKIGLHLIKQ